MVSFKIKGVLFGLCMVLSVLSTNVFAYLNDGEYVQSVQWMHENEMTRYSSASDFRPGDFLTREQAAKFFDAYALNILGVDDDESGGQCDFVDLGKADTTLLDHINNICSLGYMKGSNGVFRPTDVMTKAEAITILVRMKQGLLDETVNPWWSKYHTYAYIDGITKVSDVWALNAPVTRYEIALLLSRAAGNEFVGTSDSNLEEIMGILGGWQGLQRY